MSAACRCPPKQTVALIAWDELDKFKSGAAFSIRDADELLDRAGSKLLAGWGHAKQKLPKA